MHKDTAMNFTVKEIYTALLPGFVILLHIFVACELWNYIGKGLFHDKFWIPFLILILTLGCINNIISSAIDHLCPWRNPKDVELPPNIKKWHQVKDAIDKNEKIEDYFTRFAQARNMCGAMLLSLLIYVFITVYYRGCCPNGILVSFDLVLFLILLLHTLPHQRKRYYEVIKAEYEKLQDKRNKRQETMMINN